MDIVENTLNIFCERFFVAESICDSGDSVFEEDHVEVDQEAEAGVGEAEVA